MKRREFIKISALGTGGVAAMGILGSAFVQKVINPAIGDNLGGEFANKRIPTYCEVCFWRCAGWAYTNEKGEIWKIIGNEIDPLCNGRLCPRGTGGLGMYTDENRLRTPLIRVEENGKQVFREASWDEALDYVAQKMRSIAFHHGPESLALFNHGSSGRYFTELLQAYGSDSSTAPSYAQCRGPREVAFFHTFGEYINSPEPTDLKNCKCLVLLGYHLGENMHNTQVQEMAMAQDNGLVIVTVDPRFSTVAAKSKHFLPIKPATDNALMLAWIHIMIKNGWYDKNYVEMYCQGFEELKAHVEPFTPEWAAAICNLDAQAIIDTAWEMHHASPATIVHPGRHNTWYGDDTQRLRLVAILNALQGSWGRKGGFYFPARASVPSFPKPPFPMPKKTWRDALQGDYPLAGMSVSNAIIDRTIPKEGRDFSYKGWIVTGCNLPMTIPNTPHTLEAIQHLEMLVVIDTMPMDITGWADVVLPECTYLERNDVIRTDQGREASIALRAPLFPPKYDTKPAYWIVRELAHKIGLGRFFPFEDQQSELDWQLQQVGSSYEEMMQLGVKIFPREESEMFIKEDGSHRFNTPSGKIELYATGFVPHGFAPLPIYTKHEEPAEGFYRLNYGRAPMHTFGRTANNPYLYDLMEENTLWVSPPVAQKHNLAAGQKVWLENQDGVVSSFPISVRITERNNNDTVYMVHGFGHADKRLKRAFGRGISDTELITRVHVDPLMGGTGMRGNFVKFVMSDPKKEEVSS